MNRICKSLAVFLILWGIAVPVLAQDLRVVTVTREPFSQVENGVDVGFSLDLWAAIAEDLGLDYQIDRVERFAEMLEAVETGAADVAAANISITAEREARLDFSQPIFASGLRVMVPKDGTGGGVWSILLSWDIFLAVIAAFAVLLAGGMLMWLFERHRQEYFRGGAQEKLFPAFWWALNLVVNGGFEERVPQSAIGRFFATILVVSSLFVVSIFVATITSAMTISAIEGSVTSINDLYGKRVGTTSGSTAAAYMEARDLRFEGFEDLEALLASFEEGQLDAVVFDAPILSYYVNTDGAEIGELVGTLFLRENYGFAVPSGSPLREDIDRTLLRLTEDGTYRDLLVKWFGSANG
ncbi:MAG: transporter substrate-binding domain-containing protein [Silicimonas sp.]|nr:transporter substrate-binding domain-containing protein [Silicimonas sp.]